MKRLLADLIHVFRLLWRTARDIFCLVLSSLRFRTQKRKKNFEWFFLCNRFVFVFFFSASSLMFKNIFVEMWNKNRSRNDSMWCHYSSHQAPHIAHLSDKTRNCVRTTDKGNLRISKTLITMTKTPGFAETKKISWATIGFVLKPKRINWMFNSFRFNSNQKFISLLNLEIYFLSN